MFEANIRATRDKVTDKISKLRGGGERLRYLARVPGLIDLTNLSSSAKPDDIKKLCETAASKGTAAVCVNPIYAALARETLPSDRRVKLAVVAGGFPLSQTMSAVKAYEVATVRDAGVDEIDVVINQGALLHGDSKTVAVELQAMRRAAGNLTLKVILETCELSPEMIRLASQIAIAEGADFIKTSTGFGKQGATLDAVIVMLDVIAEEFAHSGRRIGMKPAGGIKTPDDALTYLLAVEHVLGPEWMKATLFRYGASSLLPAVLAVVGDATSQTGTQETGRY